MIGVVAMAEAGEARRAGEDNREAEIVAEATAATGATEVNREAKAIAEEDPGAGEDGEAKMVAEAAATAEAREVLAFINRSSRFPFLGILKFHANLCF